MFKKCVFCALFQVPGLGLESLGSALEAFGYTRQDYYVFPKTHLLAAWYAPPKDLYEVLPRMFVSQLQASTSYSPGTCSACRVCAAWPIHCNFSAP